MTFRNYHGCVTAHREVNKPDVWSCDYCGQRGPLEALLEGDCTFVYDTCEHCGGMPDSNECKLDCSGIAELLDDEDVYVAGFPQEES